MPRIPAVTPEAMTAEQRRVHDAIVGERKSPPVGPLAVAMHHPPLGEARSRLGLVLRFNSSFPPRLREFTILAVGRHWDSQFEWASHEGEGRKAGLSEESIATLKSGGSRFAQADEQAVFDFAAEVLTRHAISDATWQRVHDLFGTAGTVELTGLIGYYCMVSVMLNAAEVAVPPGLPTLPPRTAAP